MRSMLGLAVVLSVAGLASAAEYESRPALSIAKGGQVLVQLNQPKVEAPAYSLTGDEVREAKDYQAREVNSVKHAGLVLTPRTEAGTAHAGMR